MHSFLSPDRYFNQPELLDRVPSSFLLVGGICAALQLLGIFLVRVPPGKDQEPLISDQSVSTPRPHVPFEAFTCKKAVPSE